MDYKSNIRTTTIFGRKVPINEIFGQLYGFVSSLVSLMIVKRPFYILILYLRRKSPQEVKLRNGTIIKLSKHPHDLITFFVIFLRKDYGRIRKNSVVIDIGANIGVFSIYAAKCGAKKIYAFEPSREAYNILCENIKINGLSGIIIPINKVVSNIDNSIIDFPESSSPYNAVNQSEDVNNETNQVETISLNSFIIDCNDKNIDLIKIDCEGSEFDIIPTLTKKAIKKIAEIRMEFHDNPQPLIQHLESLGLRRSKMLLDNLWMINKIRF